jgi:drug/metabolite transporter (DMT)-like permease
MNDYTGVLLGLLAACAWGAADLIARFTGRGVGVLRTVFFTQTTAFVLISAWLILDRTGSSRLPAHSPWWAWAAALAGSAIVLSGTLCLYRAITIGVVSIVAPISASYGAVTVVLSVASGEVLGAVAIAGLMVTILGVAITSAPERTTATATAASPMPWLVPAMYSALAFGVGFWLIGAFAVPKLGWAIPIWLYYGSGAIAAGLIARSRGHSLALPRPALRALLVVHGTCGVLGYIAFSAGLRTGHVAIVTVLSSLASGVTVLLARMVLDERLSRRQWAGVGAILLGVAMLR